jgi:hypothetical protein
MMLIRNRADCISDRNYINENKKGRINQSNFATIHLNLLFHFLLSKNFGIKIYLLIVLYGCEKCSLAATEDRLTGSEKILRKRVAPRRANLTGLFRILHKINFVMCALHKHYSGYIVQKDGMGCACSIAEIKINSINLTLGSN